MFKVKRIVVLQINILVAGIAAGNDNQADETKTMDGLYVHRRDVWTRLSGDSAGVEKNVYLCTSK